MKMRLNGSAISLALVAGLHWGYVFADESIKTAESYDSYAKATGLATEKYNVPDVASFLDPAFAFATLRANVSDAGTESMELLIYFRGTNGWKFFSSALDRDGKPLIVSQLDRQIEYGTVINEQFSASLTRPYLEAHQDSGLDIRFGGKYGNLTVKLPADYVRAFLTHLTKIEASVRDKIAAAKVAPIALPSARPQLGVNYLPADANFARLAGMGEPRGVMLVRVAPNGAADRAGLKVGDVILAMDGKPVAGTLTGLQDALGSLSPSNKLSVTLWRGGQEVIVPVLLP